MSKRIFKAMMAVTLTTLLVCMALFIAILFPYFETQLSDELRNELEYLAPNVERDGLGYLERLGDGQNRLTLIDADGTVLFDSDADPAQMENHADRPEIIQAIAEDAKLKADDAALAKYFSDNMGTEDYSTYEEHFGRPYVSMVVLSELANNYLMDNAVNA